MSLAVLAALGLGSQRSAPEERGVSQRGSATGDPGSDSTPRSKNLWNRRPTTAILARATSAWARRKPRGSARDDVEAKERGLTSEAMRKRSSGAAAPRRRRGEGVYTTRNRRQMQGRPLETIAPKIAPSRERRGKRRRRGDHREGRDGRTGRTRVTVARAGPRADPPTARHDRGVQRLPVPVRNARTVLDQVESRHRRTCASSTALR